MTQMFRIYLFKETAQQVLNNKLHAKASTSVLSYGVTI